MKLQNLQYPEAGDNERGLYYWYSDEKCYVTSDKTHLTVDKGCTLHFNTYFNSFSYGKWKKYTVMDDLRLRLTLKGSFEVILLRNDAAGDAFEESTLYRQKVISDELQEFEFVYPATPEKGIVGFKIVAFEDGELQGGYYCSSIDENSIDEVNLALCICTYKRENYITANMEMLKSNVFSDDTSMLKRHLRVYIADNGQTLKPGKFETDEITIYPNMNTGGAGGFSRAMIEAIADREKYGLTHIILMDDDVVFTHHALERAYVFLRLLKDKCKDIILGGTMLRLDLPFIQHVCGEMWHIESIGSLKEITSSKVGYNLYEMKCVTRNEIEEDINHLAWWFTCFSINENIKSNLPLPIFFQYDDIDFNQRNSHMHKVTLNGVCLWHEAFEKKLSVSKEYYAMRNRLIISAIHGGNIFTKKFAKRVVIKEIARQLLMYRYAGAEIILRAVKDFFRGFEWLATVDHEVLNKEIMSMAYKFQPLDELPISFIYSEYEKNLRYEEKDFSRFVRRLTFNGWLLRANKYSVTVSSASINKMNYYRVKQVLNYDETSNKGFVAEKNYKEAWRILWQLRKVLRLIGRRFKKTVGSYRQDWQKYVTHEFWKKFLNLK